jgi:hypothetical protein
MWRDIDHDERQAGRDHPDLPRGAGVGALGADRSTRGPRDVFARDLDLPRGPQRERVRVHAHTYELRGADVRILATVGALPKATYAGKTLVRETCAGFRNWDWFGHSPMSSARIGRSSSS